MEIAARLNYLRISPRKVRLVANLIRGMDVEEARTQLKFLTKRAARPLLKLLESAIANALHNFNISEDKLYIYKITVDEGPSLKRYIPRAMGRADLILKRTSHITIVLREKPETDKAKTSKTRLKDKEVYRPTDKDTSPADKAIKKDREKKESVKCDLEEAKGKKIEEKVKIKKPEKKIIPRTKLKDIGKRIFRRKSM